MGYSCSCRSRRRGNCYLEELAMFKLIVYRSDVKWGIAVAAEPGEGEIAIWRSWQCLS